MPRLSLGVVGLKAEFGSLLFFGVPNRLSNGPSVLKMLVVIDVDLQDLRRLKMRRRHDANTRLQTKEWKIVSCSTGKGNSNRQKQKPDARRVLTRLSTK